MNKFMQQDAHNGWGFVDRYATWMLRPVQLIILLVTAVDQVF